MTASPNNEGSEMKREAVRAFLQALHKKREEREAVAVDTLLQEWSERDDFPKESLKDLEESVRGWREEGRSDEAMRKDVVKMARMMEQGFIDKRFGMENGARMRVTVLQTIDRLSPELEKQEDFGRFAKIRFDVNGLKTINDLSSEANGTEYLRRIADVMKRDYSVHWNEVLSQHAIQCHSFVEGGDEFGVFVVASKPLATEDVQRMVDWYDAKIREVDTSDLINCNDELTIRKMLGYADTDAWMALSDEERTKKLADARRAIPPDFQFPASAAGDAATLAEAAELASLSSSGSFENVLQRELMGPLLDLAVEKEKQRKEVFKKSLEEGTPRDRYYAYLLQRTKEEREIALMKLKIAEQDAELERLRAGA